MRRLLRIIAASSLLFALVAMRHEPVLGSRADAGWKEVSFVRTLVAGDPAPQGTRLPELAVIIVNGRTLTGPNSSAQRRGGRLFLPVVSIARALADTIECNAETRTVAVQRQDGIVADFNAQLNQVRENGSVTLSISGTADIVFPPDNQELMLPVEIVATLLDVSIQREEGRAITITRGGIHSDRVRAGAEHAPWELYQVEYDYNFSRRASSSDHNLTLRGSGRLGDGRFTFLTNSVDGPGHSPLPTLQGGNFRLERAGQTFVLGDFGTGTDMEFMSATVRGASAEFKLGPFRLNSFAGRARSGILNSSPLEVTDELASESVDQKQPGLGKFQFDTNIFGAYLTGGFHPDNTNRSELSFSSGFLHFAGPRRSGDMATGSLRFGSGRTRIQADFGTGEFSGTNRDDVPVKGNGSAVNLSGSLQATDQLVLQGRYAYVGQNFLSAQTGWMDPTKLIAGGLTWQPRQWVTASLSISTTKSPGKSVNSNKFETATLNFTPSRRWPTVFFSHTQSSTPQLKDASFTLISAAKQYSRFRLFVNGSRIKTFGPATLNAQAGASVQINESNTFEISQAAGNQGLASGTAAWQLSNFLGKRFNLSGGLSYMRSSTSSLRTTENVSVSVRLPRRSDLQFSYLHTQTGPSLLLSLRGFVFSSHRAERAISGPVAEVNSYGAVYGRVYQDLNLNGRFDPGVDLPQANVKVRVDGNRYVLSDPEGTYRIDTVQTGQHDVYLDLLSVRADLTLLDGAQQQVAMVSRRDSIVDFRLVRTGRISGVLWLDLNENGRLDDGEQPLADVRIVTGSGRDTMTDSNGFFLIGDLPPGEHVVLVDEKTLPELTRSTLGSLSVKVFAGSETGDTFFPITPTPAQVKRFPSK